MNVTLYHRGSGAVEMLAGLEVTVSRYNHTAMGGPESATIHADGSEVDLWALANMLRDRVEIRSDLGDLVWWGYVNSVDIRVGEMMVGLSLENMTNRVCVAYCYVPEGSQTVGQRKTTAWVSDTDSITEYGTKEMVLSLSGASDEMAEARRDTALESQKYPSASVRMIAMVEGATIGCIGWYETLNWRIYENSGVSKADTTALVAAMVASHAEFIVGTTVVNTSGVQKTEYASGDVSLMFEMEELLSAGTSTDERLLARVDAGRRLVIETAPAADARYYLLKTGDMQDPYGQPVRKELCPCGMWAELKDMIPGSVDMSHINQPSLIFIESAEYFPATGKLNLTPLENEVIWK